MGLSSSNSKGAIPTAVQFSRDLAQQIGARVPKTPGRGKVFAGWTHPALDPGAQILKDTVMQSPLSKHLNNLLPVAEAHCDGPCGIYDPASARIAAEAVRSMTKKILDLKLPDQTDQHAVARYNNTLSRYVSIKEEQAELTKRELLILWTDYFKPPHLQEIPNLHDMFWKAAKLCSACKVEVSAQHADELMAAIEEIHNVFWKTKNRKIDWMLAGG